MTLSNLVAKAVDFRPSEYTYDDMTQWVNEVEHMAVDQVFNRAVPPKAMHPPDMETVTVLPGEDNSDVEPPEPVEEPWKPYVYAEDAEKELLIPEPFTCCYLDYIFAKIDFYNAEIARYNVDSVQFEADWKEFAGWYRRTHRPRRIHDEVTNHRSTNINPW